MAHKIFVNSNFTRQIFKQSFTSLNIEPDILYPCLIEKAFELPKSFDDRSSIYEMLNLDSSKSLPRLVTSLNRYERKKNIGLAIKSKFTANATSLQEI